MAENTLMADDSALPEHFSVMLPATCCSRVPQRLLRSDGLDWALDYMSYPLSIWFRRTYPRAAIKQAGGVSASAMRARAIMAAKNRVEGAYILTEFEIRVLKRGERG